MVRASAHSLLSRLVTWVEGGGEQKIPEACSRATLAAWVAEAILI